MKTIAVVLFSLFSGLAFAQVDWDASFVARRCGGTVITEGAQAEKLKSLAKLLDPDDLGIQTYLIDSPAINAWVASADNSHALVCISLALTRWLQGSDGELAYVVAHEIGHTIDESCATAAGRSKLAAKSKDPFSLLFGTSNGNELGDSRTCEMRADLRAFMLMASAGVNTEYAISTLKRFQAATHDHRKGTIGRMFAINDSHPLLSDRIRQMERLQKKFKNTEGR